MEIPQSQTADKPVAPWGRATQQSRDTRKTKKSKATSSLFPIKMIAKLEWTQSNTQENMEKLQNLTMGVTINNESTTMVSNNYQQINNRTGYTTDYIQHESWNLHMANLANSCSFYTPPLKCGEVLCYTLRCLSVRPSVRPCSPFPIDNLSIYSWNFFKFCIHIVIGDEWYGLVNGQNPSIFNGVTALFRIGKMVSGLLFLYCSWYLNETSQICCTSKVTYCD